MSDSAIAASRQAEVLSRRAFFWGSGQSLVALALIVYAIAGDGGLSWFILAGLVATALAGGLFYLAGRALTHSASAGRLRVIAASLLGLNWLLPVSCLAIFNAVMHPDMTVTGGIGQLLIGFVAPLAHLAGNFWFLVAGLNLDTGKWRAG